MFFLYNGRTNKVHDNENCIIKKIVMKKFLIFLTTLVLFGCTTNTETQGEIKQKQVKTKQPSKEDTRYKMYFSKGSITIIGIEIEGHQYIIYDGSSKGSIIHAAHCPCHDKK